MFIPLHDANSLKHIRLQFVTLGLIAANVVVFLITSTGSERFLTGAVIGLGYIPSVVNDYEVLPTGYEIVPEPATYLTYAFLHADWLHLGGNMLFLWVFGDNVEDATGHFRFLLFYLACAAAGAFVHGLVVPTSNAPLIGASGAVAGIVAAYLLLHPRVKIWILAFGRLPLRIPALFALALWILFQFFMFFAMGEDQVSWAAHIGGILAGGLLILVLKRSGVPLFDRAVVTPRAVETGGEPAGRAQPARRAPRWGRY